jgi:hypothetical protein
MRALTLLTVRLTVLLTACPTVPNVQIAAQCPKPPALVMGYPLRDWQGQMLNFLSDTPQTPPSYTLPSSNEKLNTMP